MDALDTKQFLTGLAGVVAGGFLHWLWAAFNEWRKRIVFAAEGWELKYDSQPPSRQGEESQDTTARQGGRAVFNVTVRFYNTKSKSIGLHRFAVVFTKSRWRWFRRDLLAVKELGHGPVEYSGTSLFTIAYRNPLNQLTLVANDWTPDHIEGVCKPVDLIADSDAVWLVAETTEGRKRRWLLHSKQSE